MWDVLSGVAKIAWDVLSGAAKMAWDVLSGVTKTAWDVLSGVANPCGMFCPGCQKMAWDVLSRDVLSYIPISKYRIIRCSTKSYHFASFSYRLCNKSLQYNDILQNANLGQIYQRLGI